MTKINKVLHLLFFLFSTTSGENLSNPILDLEGGYEQRYSSALTSVLGQENYRIEIQAIIPKKDPVDIPNEIPIKFLPGLGINIDAIPQEIIESKSTGTESILALDVMKFFKKRIH